MFRTKKFLEKIKTIGIMNFGFPKPAPTSITHFKME